MRLNEFDFLLPQSEDYKHCFSFPVLLVVNLLKEELLLPLYERFYLQIGGHFYPSFYEPLLNNLNKRKTVKACL
jgi:hypothetical protein